MLNNNVNALVPAEQYTKSSWDGKFYVTYFFTMTLKKKKTSSLSMLLGQKCFSEDRNGKQSLKTGLEQTLARSKGCSEGTVPRTLFKIRVLYSKFAFFGS